MQGLLDKVTRKCWVAAEHKLMGGVSIVLYHLVLDMSLTDTNFPCSLIPWGMFQEDFSKTLANQPA